MNPGDRRALAHQLSPHAVLATALGQTDVLWNVDASAHPRHRGVPVHVRLLHWEGRWLFVWVGPFPVRRFGPFRGRGWRAALLAAARREIELKLRQIRAT